MTTRISGPSLFSADGGWGIHIGKTLKPRVGRVDLFYQNTKVNGGTFVSFNNSAGISKFRIDWDPSNGLHSHPPGH